MYYTTSVFTVDWAAEPGSLAHNVLVKIFSDDMEEKLRSRVEHKGVP